MIEANESPEEGIQAPLMNAVFVWGVICIGVYVRFVVSFDFLCMRFKPFCLKCDNFYVALWLSMPPKTLIEAYQSGLFFFKRMDLFKFFLHLDRRITRKIEQIFASVVSPVIWVINHDLSFY